MLITTCLGAGRGSHYTALAPPGAASTPAYGPRWARSGMPQPVLGPATIARAPPLRLPDRGTQGLRQLRRGLRHSYPAALSPGVSLAPPLPRGEANRPAIRHTPNRPPNRGNFR